MYLVTVRRGRKVEQRAEFPNLRDALRQLDGFVFAFPDRVSELHGASGVLWRCPASGAKARARDLEAA